MQDEPTADEILESVIAFLREDLAPQRSSRAAFDARVAANALELVRRQIAFEANGAERNEAARRRLVQLLREEGSLDELNRLLCSRIASGELGLASRPLMDHLWTTTLEKLEVDQPTYASYQRTLAERGRTRS
jgi:hypothetical protein